jgi:endonuclease/exonuclease/phosphatase family metal-dependent hydrolase
MIQRGSRRRLVRCCLVGWLVYSFGPGIFSVGHGNEPAGAAAASNEPLQLRVLSYNIHHSEGGDGKVDLGRIARVINDAHPDLVALQEVDSGTKRTAGVDQPRRLAELTKLEFVFGDNISYEGGRYGNAVLSRFPIVRHKNHPLPSHYKGEQRGVLEVEARLPNGRPPLVFYATHFDYRGNYDGERMESARLVNQLVAQRPDATAILAGDLNATPESKPLTELATAWGRDPRLSPTYPAASPASQIDHVLFRPADRWRVVESRVINEAVASDHRPLLVVLELRSIGRPKDVNP